MLPHRTSLQSLAPVDAAWYRMDSAGSPADIAGLFVLDGVVDEAALRARVAAKLLVHPRFKQRVVEPRLRLGPPRWEDEPPGSLERHFSKRSLPAPGGLAELQALVNELMNEPIDQRYSPWRICLITGYGSSVVLFSQLHHCMADGFALIELLLSMADDAGETPVGAQARGTTASLPERLTHAVRGALRVPSTLSGLLHLLRLSFDAPTRLRGALAGRRRVAWSSPLSLDRFRALAHARRSTINDVLLTVLTGALRAYLVEHGDAPQPVRAVVPVNLRTQLMAASAERSGNWFGLVFIDLPLDTSERELRMGELKRTVDRIKASDEPLASLVVLTLLGRLPQLVESAFKLLFARKGTVVVSNVVGPRSALMLLGRRVREIMFWVPHPSGLSCGVSLLSYDGVVHVGVRSDEARVPDPERLAQLFELELSAWEAEAGSMSDPEHEATEIGAVSTGPHSA